MMLTQEIKSSHSRKMLSLYYAYQKLIRHRFIDNTEDLEILLCQCIIC